MARNSLKNVMQLIARANEEVPVEKQFLDDLKRSIEMSDKKNARVPSQTYKPSSMNCMRQMYYVVTGEQAQSDSSYVLVGICEAGTDRHDRIQKAIMQMKENGFDCEYVNVAEYVKEKKLPLQVVEQQGNETKLYDPEYNISFLCDGIIKYQGKYYIVEFKTESIYKWQDRKGVDPKHYNQARTYSWKLHLDNVIFVYINRDICDMKSYMYHVSASEREQIRALLDTCQTYVEKHELPPIQDNVTKKTCAYCGYKHICGGVQ